MSVGVSVHHHIIEYSYSIMSQLLNSVFLPKCHGPENEADLESSMSEYTSAGFPGCLESTDGVHISWDRCHAMQKMLHTGKEKYPTIAYNVTVNHRRWIMASSRGFVGSYNDKTIVKYDAFINDIRQRKTFHDYNLFLRRNGMQLSITGAWILCDGGYCCFHLDQDHYRRLPRAGDEHSYHCIGTHRVCQTRGKPARMKAASARVLR
jgi:Plant transposon protein